MDKVVLNKSNNGIMKVVLGMRNQIVKVKNVETNNQFRLYFIYITTKFDSLITLMAPHRANPSLPLQNKNDPNRSKP